MAIACLGFVTTSPLPDLSVPFFIFLAARAIVRSAFFEYLAIFFLITPSYIFMPFLLPSGFTGFVRSMCNIVFGVVEFSLQQEDITVQYEGLVHRKSFIFLAN